MHKPDHQFSGDNEPPQETSNPAVVEKLALTTKEACAALGVSSVTLWRLEQRQLIRSVRVLRTKLYHVDELRRFLRDNTAGAA